MNDHDPFFSHATHKLLTRITAIAGYAQGLEQGIIAPEEAGSRIRKECVSLTEEIRNLTSTALLDYEQIPYESDALPLSEILENCIDRFSGKGKEKGLSLKLTKDKKEFWVPGDETLLEDILDNLLSNAIRYAKNGIIITIRTEEDRVLLTVEDDGEGIREEDLPHIFDSFYKGPGGNLGLGLSIARKAAERMGGTLTAENRPEGGAAFTLTLIKDSSR